MVVTEARVVHGSGRPAGRVGSGRVKIFCNFGGSGRVGSAVSKYQKKLKCNMLYDRLMVALLFIPHSDKCNLDE